jgi:GTP-binding protein LepA
MANSSVVGCTLGIAKLVSAKTGFGIDELMEAIVKMLPPPKGSVDAKLKALLVDSWYDSYLGVVVLIRVFEGKSKNRKNDLQEVGV